MEQKELLPLLSRVRDGESDAFSLLCASFEGMMQKAVRAFSSGGCDADVSELSHEARLALYRAACTYREDGGVTFGLYARVCVRNALISFLRSRALPDGVSLCEYDGTPADESDPIGPLLAEERLAELMNMMGRVLSAYEMQVLVRLIDGEKVAMIAEELGKSEKSVSNAVFRIQSKLRTQLGE